MKTLQGNSPTARVDSMSLRITEERNRLGMTQTELASALGLSRNSVTLYEAGKHQPGAEALTGLHRVGIDVLYVLTGMRSVNAVAEVLDIDRLALSLEEARRQMDLGKEVHSQREILQRALPIYQALGNFLKSGNAGLA
ncbi:MAG: helix-turn-helix domain-containing protein [Hylemonella sp.]